jgi:LuxR family transcriptional regulator, quorum-sensing system regulator SolR
MKNNRPELMRAVMELSETESMEKVLQHVCAIPEVLGFDQWFYAVRMPLPASRRGFECWRGNTKDPMPEAKPYAIDSIHYKNISHLIEKGPQEWCDCPQLEPLLTWGSGTTEHGIVTPVWGNNGIFGIFALGRDVPVVPIELAKTAAIHEWFAVRVHRSFVKVRVNQWNSLHHEALSDIEIKILQWTADGKSAELVSKILGISERMVTFHVTNSLKKLRTTNKTAAVAKALTLGLI